MLMVVVGVGFFLSARRDDSGQITSAGSMNVTELVVGDCFDLEDDEATQVENVNAKPCSEPHVYEVYHVSDLPAGDYPAEREISSIADSRCLAAFQPYVGLDYASSVLYYTYLTPTPDGWEQGDHTIQCVVFHPDLTAVSSSYRNYRQ